MLINAVCLQDQDFYPHVLMVQVLNAYHKSVVNLTSRLRKEARQKFLDSVQRHDQIMAREAEFEDGSLEKGEIESRDTGPGINIKIKNISACM